MSAAILAPRVVAAAAEATLGIALIVIVVGLLHSGDPRRDAASSFANSLMLGLEFLLAGGLLRLALGPTLARLGLTALIIAIRTVIKRGLGLAVRAAAHDG